MAKEERHGCTCHKIHYAPTKKDESGLAKVGLHRQDQNNRNSQDERPKPSRRAANVLRSGHHPSSYDDETGLEKFRRLHRRKAKRIPPGRPLAEVSAEKRKQDQRNERRDKAHNRKTTHDNRAQH